VPLTVGLLLGADVGVVVGIWVMFFAVGAADGASVGAADGALVGAADGALVGARVLAVGLSVGALVGDFVGGAVGDVGASVGSMVGDRAARGRGSAVSCLTFRPVSFSTTPTQSANRFGTRL